MERALFFFQLSNMAGQRVSMFTEEQVWSIYTDIETKESTWIRMMEFFGT